MSSIKIRWGAIIILMAGFLILPGLHYLDRETALTSFIMLIEPLIISISLLLSLFLLTRRNPGEFIGLLIFKIYFFSIASFILSSLLKVDIFYPVMGATSSALFGYWLSRNE